MNYQGMRVEEEADNSASWLSVGDLMSGLLMIFALLLMVTLTQLSDAVEQSKKSRIVVIKALTDAMQSQGINAEVDPVTGDVSIVDSILFDIQDARLKKDGASFLDRFVPVYSGVLFSRPEITEQITRVVIEGHTSSDGDYSYNMGLSLDRAQNVVSYLAKLDFDDKDKFLSLLMPAGRGEIDADPESAKSEDRKVLFRFQFRGDTEDFVKMLNSKAESH